MHLKILLRVSQLLLALCFISTAGLAQTPDKPYEPTVGQEGKDVVWVPTPTVTVEKMLDVAKITPEDFVMDLGSGDGRNIIAAAKRGVPGLGVEFNAEMVEYSRRVAAREGVGEIAQFVEGDMFAADLSRATVLALFLLPDNLNKLMPNFLDLKPGTRIVLNHFGIDGWEADETTRADGDCGSWCTVLLLIVPAKVQGTWLLPQGKLKLEQKFQKLTGTLTAGGASAAVEGRLRGDEITFTAGGVTYEGRVNGEIIAGVTKGSQTIAWKAVRKRS
jgi:SAM-dependent methyltransferase